MFAKNGNYQAIINKFTYFFAAVSIVGALFRGILAKNRAQGFKKSPGQRRNPGTRRRCPE